MLLTLLKLYLFPLMIINFFSLSIFLTGLYFILRKALFNTKSKKIRSIIEDFSSISGDDVGLTQLDLARAYIEADKKSHAVIILNEVISGGKHIHREEASRLLKTL